MKKRDKRLIKSEGVALKRARYVKVRLEKNRLAKAAKLQADALTDKIA